MRSHGDRTPAGGAPKYPRGVTSGTLRELQVTRYDGMAPSASSRTTLTSTTDSVKPPIRPVAIGRGSAGAGLHEHDRDHPEIVARGNHAREHDGDGQIGLRRGRAEIGGLQRRLDHVLLGHEAKSAEHREAKQRKHADGHARR